MLIGQHIFGRPWHCIRAITANAVITACVIVLATGRTTELAFLTTMAYMLTLFPFAHGKA